MRAIHKRRRSAKACVCEGLFCAACILLLDEATSALDSALTKGLLTALKHDFPHLGILSITHQEELKFIFDKVIDIGSVKQMQPSTVQMKQA